MSKTNYGISISPDGTRLLVSIPVECVVRFIEPSVKDGRLNTMHLSPREMQVFQLVRRGLVTKEIADNLGLAVRTVKFHLGSIYAKLHMTRVKILQYYGVNEGTQLIQ